MRIPRSISIAVLASAFVVAILALAACGGDGDETTTPAESGGANATEAEPAPAQGGNAPAPSGEAVRSEKVEIVDFAYDPDPVTIQEGGKVTWINRDAEAHTATADDGSFDTGTLEEGKLKSESFKEPGEYPYFCEIHPQMRGTVEVVPSD
ncbi:MAG TPA: cupredoxin family copper-binding protein [Solirubrobacterales bacterium]